MIRLRQRLGRHSPATLLTAVRWHGDSSAECKWVFELRCESFNWLGLGGTGQSPPLHALFRHARALGRPKHAAHNLGTAMRWLARNLFSALLMVRTYCSKACRKLSVWRAPCGAEAQATLGHGASLQDRRLSSPPLRTRSIDWLVANLHLLDGSSQPAVRKTMLAAEAHVQRLVVVVCAWVVTAPPAAAFQAPLRRRVEACVVWCAQLHEHPCVSACAPPAPTPPP